MNMMASGSLNPMRLEPIMPDLTPGRVCLLLAAGYGSHNQKGLGACRHRVGQQRVRRFM